MKRVIVLVAAVAVAVPVLAAPALASGPTFSTDVAPIFQRACQRCHQETGIGPMSLVTYDEVRPWVRQIRDRVERRIMPPWHIDRTVGIQAFKNDFSLTDAEIDTVVRWVDAGGAGGQPGRPAAADRLAARVRLGARQHARPARSGRELHAVHRHRQRAGPVVEPDHRVRGHPRGALDQGRGVQAVVPARRAGRPSRPCPAAAAGGRFRSAAGGHGRRQALGGAAGGRRQAGAARTGAGPLQPALLSGRGDGRGRRGGGRRLVPPERLTSPSGSPKGRSGC